jgi:hypothetical protein
MVVATGLVRSAGPSRWFRMHPLPQPLERRGVHQRLLLSILLGAWGAAAFNRSYRNGSSSTAAHKTNAGR